MSWLSSLFKKKKNDAPQIQTYQPPPYSGQRPYSGSEVGLGSDVLSPLSSAYLQQIRERSQGQGLVGFPQGYTSLAKQNINADFDYQGNLDRQRLAGQASGQGLRGGIPMSIANQYGANLQRNRSNALNQIDIADLEAKREDINRATYAQPELVNMGSNIQQNRAAFDLNEYNATAPQPYLIDQPQQQPSMVLPSLINAAGSIGAAYLQNQNPYTLALSQLIGNNNNLSGLEQIITDRGLGYKKRTY